MLSPSPASPLPQTPRRLPSWSHLRLLPGSQHSWWLRFLGVAPPERCAHRMLVLEVPPLTALHFE